MRRWSLLLQALTLETQGCLRARGDGLADPIFVLRRHVRHEDVQVVVVVKIENLGDDPHTDGVRLTRIRIDDDLHDNLPLSSPLVS
jgi:hypothetical protein